VHFKKNLVFKKLKANLKLYLGTLGPYHAFELCTSKICALEFRSSLLTYHSRGAGPEGQLGQAQLDQMIYMPPQELVRGPDHPGQMQSLQCYKLN
jgi:hypothetical protein